MHSLLTLSHNPNYSVAISPHFIDNMLFVIRRHHTFNSVPPDAETVDHKRN